MSNCSHITSIYLRSLKILRKPNVMPAPAPELYIPLPHISRHELKALVEASCTCETSVMRYLLGLPVHAETAASVAYALKSLTESRDLVTRCLRLAAKREQL